MPIAEQLATGLRYHQSGEFEAAERSYRAVLSVAPKNADALHLLGLLALQEGKAEQAAESIRGAIRLNGNVAAYHGNLGVALCTLKLIDDAVRSFQKAIRLDPSYAEAYNNMASPLCQQGKPEAAIDALRRAVVLKPGYAEAWNNLGTLYWERGVVAEAVACLREVVRLKPSDAASCDNLATALRAQGRFDEAVAWYRRAIECAPNFAAPYNNLANLLKEQGKIADAIACYQRALQLDPRFAEALVGLAATQHDLAQYDDAVANYSTAIALKPSLAAAHFNLGTIHEERGEFAQAEQLFRTAIGCDARFAPAYGELAAVLRGRFPEADIRNIQSLLTAPGLSEEDAAVLHFALALAFDAQGDYAKAAEHSIAANALRLAQWRACGQLYHRDAHSDFIDRTIAQFTPDYFARVRGWGDASQRPVFIVGMPRAGTTLLEQILAGHPHVYAAGELTLTRDGFEAAFGHVKPKEPRPAVSREQIERLSQRHLATLNNQNATAFRVVAKLPENYLYLGYLATILPQATIIHCRRDPRDVALSCWLTNFRSVRWASDIEDVVTRFREYDRLMDHWRSVLPTRIIEISYEETISHLEHTARRVLACCGLEWEPRCMDFHRVQRPVQTASVVQVRQPVYRTSIGKWQHYAESLQPLLSRF